MLVSAYSDLVYVILGDDALPSYVLSILDSYSDNVMDLIMVKPSSIELS